MPDDKRFVDEFKFLDMVRQLNEGREMEAEKTQKERPFCIYHGNCQDGFASAWIVNKFFKGDVDFHPGVYGEAPPDVAGRKVYMVDFSYKRPVLLHMAAEAKQIIILDHHETSAEDLIGLPSNVHTVFRKDRCGAMISWDWFFEDTPPPMLLAHIDDRDRWQFKYPETRDISAALFSYPYDFEVWEKLMSSDLSSLEKDGAAINRKHFADINNILPAVTREMIIAGHKVKIANIPLTMTSDAGNILAKDAPFAGCYWDTPEGRVFSLRSTNDGLNVAEIAAQYGGGGHRNASGFRLSFDAARKFEIGANK